jgi:hypothetical protein
MLKRYEMKPKQIQFTGTNNIELPLLTLPVLTEGRKLSLIGVGEDNKGIQYRSIVGKYVCYLIADGTVEACESSGTYNLPFFEIVSAPTFDKSGSDSEEHGDMMHGFLSYASKVKILDEINGRELMLRENGAKKVWCLWGQPIVHMKNDSDDKYGVKSYCEIAMFGTK